MPIKAVRSEIDKANEYITVGEETIRFFEYAHKNTLALIAQRAMVEAIDILIRASCCGEPAIIV